MTQQKMTVYPDTSVVNFLFATGSCRAETTSLFAQGFRTKIYRPFISAFVLPATNNTKATEKRCNLLNTITDCPLPSLDLPNAGEVENPARTYVREGTVPAKKEVGALRLAVSVINETGYRVSGAFQHSANFNRERRVPATGCANNYYLHPL